MDARFPRVVLVADWLTGMRGGEKCLDRLCRRWPDAPLFPLFHVSGSVSPEIERRQIIATGRPPRARLRARHGRDSPVTPPPVDTDFYHPAGVEREDYYLVVSAFAPYKRIDLAIAACQRLDRRLVVIGTGQDERRLRTI